VEPRKEEVPCPAAKQVNCDLMFETKRNANRHAKAMHAVQDEKGNTVYVPDKQKPIACLFANQMGCEIRFRSQEELNIHLLLKHK
jgi:hypothetical protein